MSEKWTIILLDHNGHREERIWNGMPPLRIEVPLPLKFYPYSHEGNLEPIGRSTKSYKPSSWNKELRKVIYLEESSDTNQ